MMPHPRRHLEQIAIKFFEKAKESLLKMIADQNPSDVLKVSDLADTIVMYEYKNEELYRRHLKNFVLLYIIDLNEVKYELKRLLVKLLTDEYLKQLKDKQNEKTINNIINNN